MRAILNCPFIPIASRLGSHRGAQGAMYADMIRETGVQLDINWSGKIEDHNQYDVMYVYHGNDFSGGINIFGGVQGFPYAFNTRNFSKFKGKVYSLAIDFPPYHEMIANRIKKGIEHKKDIQQEWLDIDIDNLKRMHDTAETIQFPNITDKVVIGDSHSICMYRPGWTVYSKPFKTLHGVISDGLRASVDYIKGANSVNIDIKSAEFYFGNIDLRHHLCRIPGDPEQNTKDLALKYLKAVEDLDIMDVGIYELLPIENESRKLPKSGYYKGKPFHGSWEQRNHLRNVFKDTLKDNTTRCRIIEWTDYLLNDKGELSFDYMEKPHSIHLSREYYPYWKGETAKK